MENYCQPTTTVYNYCLSYSLQVNNWTCQDKEEIIDVSSDQGKDKQSSYLLSLEWARNM